MTQFRKKKVLFTKEKKSNDKKKTPLFEMVSEESKNTIILGKVGIGRKRYFISPFRKGKKPS